MGRHHTLFGIPSYMQPALDCWPSASLFFLPCFQTAADATYLARHAALKAGVRIEVPALTLNRLCGSGFQSVVTVAQEILLGEAQVGLAGGAENMSQSPMSVYGQDVRWGTRLGQDMKLVDTLWAGLTDSYAGEIARIDSMTPPQLVPHIKLESASSCLKPQWCDFALSISDTAICCCKLEAATPNGIKHASLTGTTLPQVRSGCAMGMTAENLAAEYGISRLASDEFALSSQEKWSAAHAAGAFRSEIAPIEVRGKKGMVSFETDEHPRATTIEKLGTLATTFKKDGI
eukprot:6200116-Pleurochrysis_carterae.AAC.1